MPSICDGTGKIDRDAIVSKDANHNDAMTNGLRWIQFDRRCLVHWPEFADVGQAALNDDSKIHVGEIDWPNVNHRHH